MPPEQQAIRDRCFHPSGAFVEFPVHDIETSIPDRFEKMVAIHPNRLAFKCGNQTATYSEINRFANQCARALTERLGFDSEPIGVLLENGVGLFAAVFGILKANKFVVSVDPTLPAERVARLNPDSLDSGIGDANLTHSIPATSPAFSVYTSGLTGTPKQARVPFFFKQWGGVNKKKTGRELNGRTYDEMPANYKGLALQALPHMNEV